MSHDANVTRWYFSDQAGRDQIMVNMMNRLDELERYKAENEARKGVHTLLKEMEQRSVNPIFKLSKSMDEIAEYKEKLRKKTVN